MANKGALATDPTPKKGTPRAKTHMYQGTWVDEQGYRVDGYGRRLPGQTQPFEKKKDQKAQPPATQQPPVDPYTGQPETPYQQLTQEQRDAQIEQGFSEWMRGQLGQIKPFDPGSFDQQAQNAYQNTLAQFEADNADTFKQQEAAFYQRAAEQGMDPNSPGYAALYKQEVTDRQDRARQQAQRSAFDAAEAVRQRGFAEAYQTFMAPGEQFGQYAPTWGQLQKTGAESRNIQLELENRLRIAREQNRAEIEKQKIAARASGGGQQGPTMYERWQASQIEGGYGTPQGNIGNAVITGAAGGAGGAVVNNLQAGPVYNRRQQ